MILMLFEMFEFENKKNTTFIKASEIIELITV
jgi:hypothetical protein